MRFIDLFAGVGGFRIALEGLGHECVFTSEINSNCQKVYSDNFGEIPCGDITKVDPRAIPDFDVLCAGFPCQPFSLCGKKEGFKDEARGTLFFNIADIVSTKKPKMILLENVKGIVTHDKGHTLEVIKGVLREHGYTVHDKVLNTYQFGIPQYRERWYCVAFREDVSGFEFPAGDNPGSLLADVMDVDHHDEALLFPEEENNRIDYHFANMANSPRVEHCNAHCNPKSKKGRHGIFSYLKPDNALRFHTGDVAKSQIQDDYYVSMKSVSPTLIATRAPKAWDLRRHLSVDECKRLQAFPAHFDFSSVSINVAKKQLGNAVTVEVVSQVARRMFEAHQERYQTVNFERRRPNGSEQLELLTG